MNFSDDWTDAVIAMQEKMVIWTLYDNFDYLQQQKVTGMAAQEIAQYQIDLRAGQWLILAYAEGRMEAAGTSTQLDRRR
jgi:hypothetical protein